MASEKEKENDWKLRNTDTKRIYNVSHIKKCRTGKYYHEDFIYQSHDSM